MFDFFDQADTIRAAVNAPNQEVEPGGGACERFQQNRVIGSCCAIQSRNSRTKEDKGALKPAVDPHATALSSLKAGSFRGRTYPSRGWTVPPIPSATSFETDILIREAGGDRQGGKRIDAHPTAADRDKGNEVDRQRWEVIFFSSAPTMLAPAICVAVGRSRILETTRLWGNVCRRVAENALHEAFLPQLHPFLVSDVLIDSVRGAAAWCNPSSGPVYFDTEGIEVLW